MGSESTESQSGSTIPPQITPGPWVYDPELGEVVAGHREVTVPPTSMTVHAENIVAESVLRNNGPLIAPAWRCRSDGCEQPLTFGSTTRCYYHRKLEALPILDGQESRANYGQRGPGNHSGRARPRYDYATWFDGQPHTLTQGVDFPADMKSMLSMLRRAAVRLGADVIVSHTGPVITVQATPKREAGAA